MFIGRKKELATLEKLYNSNELNCVCLTGGAGMGKTALLQEFARRKHKAYFAYAQVPIMPIRQLFTRSCQRKALFNATVAAGRIYLS